MQKHKTETLTVRLPAPLIKAIKEMAEEEQRTVSNMGSVLLTKQLKSLKE